MDPHTAISKPHATYGALLVGLIFATFLQGVLTTQLHAYFERYPKDPRYVKLLVIAVWITDTIHLVLISLAVYYFLVSIWGDTDTSRRSILPFNLHLTFVGLSTVMCQGFFLHRIWIFSHYCLLVVVPLALGCCTNLIWHLYVSFRLVMNPPAPLSFHSYPPRIVALFSISAAVDIAIAFFLWFYLRRGTGILEGRNSLVSHVIHNIIATSMATSFLAVACLTAYLSAPRTFVYMAMHFSLGRMYTTALMANLNSRIIQRGELLPAPASPSILSRLRFAHHSVKSNSGPENWVSTYCTIGS
ncbi:hypothetical protein BD779DRAFT_587408 [Infundibulicybe gibba]|nr:hypothetical protein BD779DRAFT_587408 [Infundibulicybe gibba]